MDSISWPADGGEERGANSRFILLLRRTSLFHRLRDAEFLMPRPNYAGVVS
jgi:hypothetical protein